MSWLLRDEDVLAALEDRRPGWTAAIQGAVILRGLVVVHTIVSPVSLDVARCADVTNEAGVGGLEVRRIASLSPRRMARPQMFKGAIVVAGAGAFERWNLQVGDRLEIRL